jgi:hypothetical protein
MAILLRKPFGRRRGVQFCDGQFFIAQSLRLPGVDI